MIQDINTHKLDIVYDGKAILEESDLIVAFSEKDVYMKKTAGRGGGTVFSLLGYSSGGIQTGGYGTIPESCRVSASSGWKEAVFAAGQVSEGCLAVTEEEY